MGRCESPLRERREGAETGWRAGAIAGDGEVGGVEDRRDEWGRKPVNGPHFVGLLRSNFDLIWLKFISIIIKLGD